MRYSQTSVLSLSKRQVYFLETDVFSERSIYVGEIRFLGTKLNLDVRKPVEEVSPSSGLACSSAKR